MILLSSSYVFQRYEMQALTFPILGGFILFFTMWLLAAVPSYRRTKAGKRNINWILPAFVGVALIVAGRGGKRWVTEIKEHYAETCGITSGQVRLGKSWRTQFKYVVNNKHYQSTTIERGSDWADIDDVPATGGKYMVVFSQRDPSICFLDASRSSDTCTLR